MIDIRLFLAVAAGRSAGIASRVLRRGGGTTLPGVVARRRLLDRREIRQALSDGLVGYAARTGELVNVPDVSQDPRYITPVEPALDHTRSELAVPMKRVAASVITTCTLAPARTSSRVSSAAL